MEDEKIIELFFARSETAIRELDSKYGKVCYSISYNILNNNLDAEECVNDAYFNLWNSIPPNRPQMLSSFLGKIVRNLAFNKYKRNTAEKRGGGELTAVLDELKDCVSDKDDVEKAFEHKTLASDINEFLGTLPAKKRNIFLCRYWYTDSISDIAARYGMTSAAVSMMLSRLRTKLHDFLVDKEYEL